LYLLGQNLEVVEIRIPIDTLVVDHAERIPTGN
jgi:hypothetical protein